MSIRCRHHSNQWMRPPDPVHKHRQSTKHKSNGSWNLFLLPPLLGTQPFHQEEQAALLELPPEAVVDITETKEEEYYVNHSV